MFLVPSREWNRTSGVGCVSGSEIETGNGRVARSSVGYLITADFVQIVCLLTTTEEAVSLSLDWCFIGFSHCVFRCSVCIGFDSLLSHTLAAGSRSFPLLYLPRFSILGGGRTASSRLLDLDFVSLRGRRTARDVSLRRFQDRFPSMVNYIFPFFPSAIARVNIPRPFGECIRLNHCFPSANCEQDAVVEVLRLRIDSISNKKGRHVCVWADGEEESVIDIACFGPSQDRATSNFQFNHKIKRKTFFATAVQCLAGASDRCDARQGYDAAETANGNIVYGFLQFRFASGSAPTRSFRAFRQETIAH